jgi:hypothetical protein
MNILTRFLITSTHYDDRGYPIRWHRSIIPSNILATVNGLAEDASGEITRAEWTVERLAMMAPATRPLQKNRLGRFVRTLRAFIGGVLRELRTSWQS